LTVAVVAKEDARRRQRSLLAVSAIGDIEIEPAVIAEIDEEGTAALARSAELFLFVETEFTPVVAEKNAGFGAGVVEGADEEIGPAVAVHVAPGGGVAADAGQVGEDPCLVADVAEHEGVFGLFLRPFRGGASEEDAAQQRRQQKGQKPEVESVHTSVLRLKSVPEAGRGTVSTCPTVSGFVRFFSRLR